MSTTLKFRHSFVSSTAEWDPRDSAETTKHGKKKSADWLIQPVVLMFGTNKNQIRSFRFYGPGWLATVSFARALELKPSAWWHSPKLLRFKNILGQSGLENRRNSGSLLPKPAAGICGMVAVNDSWLAAFEPLWRSPPICQALCPVALEYIACWMPS